MRDYDQFFNRCRVPDEAKLRRNEHKGDPNNQNLFSAMQGYIDEHKEAMEEYNKLLKLCQEYQFKCKETFMKPVIELLLYELADVRNTAGIAMRACQKLLGEP